MNNYIIPTVGMRGKFSLSPPLDQLCLPGEEYTCQAVRRLADYIGNNEDPLNDIYLLYELTEADFKRDMLEDMFIASLQSQSGHWVYVPVRYIQTFPDPGGVPYRTLMMGVNLGPQPNEDDFLHLQQEVTDLVIRYVGVVPKIKMVQTSKTVLVPREKHDEIVAVRNSKKTTALTDGSKYREVYLKYERALAQVKALENYIRCQLCCPGCFSNTPTTPPTAAPTPEPTMPPVPTVEPISIQYTVSAPPPVVTEGEPVMFEVTGQSTPVVDNLYWEIEKVDVPTDEYFIMSGTVPIVNQGKEGDFYATLVDPGTYLVCLYVDSTKTTLLNSSTFEIAIAPTEAPTPQPTPAPPPPCCIPVSAPCSAPPVVEDVQYRLIPAAMSVEEGSCLAFNVVASRLPSISSLYWEVSHGTTTLSDISNSSGNVSLSSGTSWSFNVCVNTNPDYTGDKSFTVNLYTDPTKTDLLDSTGTITLTDMTPAPTEPPTTGSYSIVGSPTSVIEGGQFSMSVGAPSNMSNATLYWQVTHQSTASRDFVLTSGSVTLNASCIGAFKITTSVTSAGVGGDKNFVVRLYRDALRTDEVAVSSSLTIVNQIPTAMPTEAPTTSPETYALSASPLYVNEGSQMVLTATGSIGAINKTVYWKVVHGTTTSGDFNTTSGSLNLGSTASGSFTLATVNNAAGLQGDKTFTVKLYRDSAGTAEVASTGTITIKNENTSVNQCDFSVDSSVTWGPLFDQQTVGNLYTVPASGEFEFSFSPPTTIPVIPSTAVYTLEVDLKIRTGHSPLGTWSVSEMVGNVAVTRLSATRLKATLSPGTYYFAAQYKLKNPTGNVCGVSGYKLVDMTTEYAVVVTEAPTEAPTQAPIGYTLTASPLSVNEGGTVGLTIVANSLAAKNKTVYWKVIHGTSTSGDIGASNGFSTLGAAGTGSFNVVTSVNAAGLQSDKTFTVGLYNDFGFTTLLATSQTVTIKNLASTNPDPTYSVTTNAATYEEGSTISGTVTTTNVADGTTVYLTIAHVSTSAGDFASSSTSVNISGNKGYFTLSPVADSVVEAGETFTIKARTGGTSGAVVAESAVITVTDKATPAPATYAISTDATSYTEGSTISGTVTTTNVADGTVVYLSINHGSTTNDDFNTVAGSTTVNGNKGYFTLSVVNDTSVESTETFTISARTNSSTGTVVATTGTLSIVNTTLPPATYSITSDSTNINGVGTAFYNEGETATFVVTSTNVADGTALKWKIVNTTTSSNDLSAQGGDFTINGNVGSFTITVNSDSLIETTEYFKVQITRTDGTVLATGGDVGVINVTPPTQAPAVPTVTGFGVHAYGYSTIFADLSGTASTSFRGILRAHGTGGNGDSAVSFDNWAIVKTSAGVPVIQQGPLEVRPGIVSGHLAAFNNEPPTFRVGSSMSDYPVNWELYVGSNINEVRSYNSWSGRYEWNPAKKVASTSYYTYSEPYIKPGGDGDGS